MKKLLSINFNIIGEYEYILGKAGLYEVKETEQGQTLQPTEKLAKFFKNKELPPEETLVPLLVRMIDYADHMGGINRAHEAGELQAAFAAAKVTNFHGDYSKLLLLVQGATREAAAEAGLQPEGLGL